MGMKSFSTMSIAAEIEKEDKIRDLENVVDDQRAIIQHQNHRKRRSRDFYIKLKG